MVLCRSTTESTGCLHERQTCWVDEFVFGFGCAFMTIVYDNFKRF